jgi:MoCo/4Fe-4S cofactor protein with predicted Tat translocation signal
MSPMNSDNPQKTSYWRSLEELSGSPEYAEYLEHEFPKGASEAPDEVSRREFITVMGASVALATFTGCRRPVEHIVPYVEQPEEIVPGKHIDYATTMPLGEDAFGILVRSHEGRPTKVEGNAMHPGSVANELPGNPAAKIKARGAATAFAIASMLDLYDPDRKPHNRAGENWSKLSELAAGFGNGSGVAVLSEGFSSPTTERLATAFEAKYPRAQWVTYDPINNENVYKGTKAAFGTALRPIHSFDRAQVTLSLDFDLVNGENNMIRNAADFAKGRHIRDRNEDDTKIGRLYAVESSYSLTGGIADHRLRLRSSQIPAFAAAIAAKLGIDVPAGSEKFDEKFVNALVKDLQGRSNALVVAGRRQPAIVHALAAAINDKLDSIGTTVRYVQPQDTRLSDTTALAGLVGNMKSGAIQTIIIIGGDPAYNAPGDLDFGGALAKVGTRVYLADRTPTEPKDDDKHTCRTAAASTLVLQRSHYLEGWGDARSYDGTASVIQPLIEPLYKTRTTAEFINLLTGNDDVNAYELVRKTWDKLLHGVVNENDWRKVIHNGVLAKSAYKSPNVRTIPAGVKALAAGAPAAISGVELVLVASTSTYDGRYANNGWLQETSDTVTKVSWDNVALVSPVTAGKIGIKEKGQNIKVASNGTSITIPALIQPGHADNSVTIELGFGVDYGRVSKGAGTDAYALRSSQNADVSSATVSLAAGITELATTQDYHGMKDRPLFRQLPIQKYTAKGEKHSLEPHAHWMDPEAQLFASHDYSKGYQWGMVIDLNTCNGCNACIIACQSENNIPVVGRKQTEKGREMAWLRIDRYFSGDINDPGMVAQPVPCMHCENAPCEQVCPVAATTHDAEGLNVMVYNRCIGTRYCANNCPYKVRRFNFFNFTKETPEVQKMANNPEVTVRSRGVMEKCTYCVQRINEGRINAKLDGNRQIADGEVQTACQQACPAGAIVFGNINMPENDPSRVTSLKENDRNYQLLQDLNTRPRTSYLGKITNPNTDLVTIATSAHDDHAGHDHDHDHEGH